MLRIQRLLVSAAAAASVLALTPAAAPAGETARLTTDGLGNATDVEKGYIRAALTVDFPSRRAYDIRGWVEDVCPRDGNGGYVRDAGSNVLAQDSNGCGNGKVYFDPPPHRSVGAPVPGITLRLCEWDADGGTRLYCTSHYFDNRRVP